MTEKYPRLEKAIKVFIETKGVREKDGVLPDLIWYFKKLYADGHIKNIQEFFNWDDETYYEFDCCGSNSRWKVVWFWAMENSEDAVRLARESAENFGDMIPYKGYSE